MTKEYIGEEFRAPYCEALAKGYVEWEFFCITWIAGTGLPPLKNKNAIFRFKPTPRRMVTLYDAQGKPHQLVAPERDVPKTFVSAWLLSGTVTRFRDFEYNLATEAGLRAGCIFLTREDAQAMADFQRKQRLGEV